MGLSSPTARAATFPVKMTWAQGRAETEAQRTKEKSERRNLLSANLHAPVRSGSCPPDSACPGKLLRMES